MGTEASAQLDQIYAPIQEEVELLTDFLRGEFESAEPFIFEILEHISRFRGKQIRPALLFLTHRLAGGTVEHDVVKIGAVLEMIHTATLVHDDLLDDASLRRKVATVHTRWGERAAILIGDFIYSRAFQLSTEVPGMAQVLSATTHKICEGELLQIGHRHRPDMSEDIYFEIIRKKTAILHSVACRLGGVFAGLGEERCEHLSRFGMDLGMAFQIVDDCLDYSGDESVVGKSLGTDLHQGKVTLPLIYLRESLSSPDRAEDLDWLMKSLRGPLEPDVERRVQEMVRDHGVLTEVFSRANGFIQRAKATLEEVGSDEDLLGSLELVTDYVLKRRR